jgi:hypothetical protein
MSADDRRRKVNKNRALQLVLDELDRALETHPKFNSAHEGYAVILEELDELWAEVKENNGRSHRGLSEATQTAAMALRYLIDLCEETAAQEHEKKIVAHKQKKTRSEGGRGGIPLSDRESFRSSSSSFGGYSG